jgi:hypothetical protein
VSAQYTGRETVMLVSNSLVPQIYPLNELAVTERLVLNSNAFSSYSGSSWFEPRPVYRISCLRFLLVFSVPPIKCRDISSISP